MIKVAIFITLLFSINIIACEKYSTDLETIIKDIRTGEYSIQVSDSKIKVQNYFDSMKSSNVFAIFEKIAYKEQNKKAEIDYFIKMFSKYENIDEYGAVDLILLINESEQNLDTFITNVIAIGSYSSKNKIDHLKLEYPNSIIITDADLIKKMTKSYDTNFLERNNKNVYSVGDTGEIALWLLLMLIFGPVVIVIFIVLACFKWICRRGHH